MATVFTEHATSADPIEIQINESIDRMIGLLNERRLLLLATLKEERKNERAQHARHRQMEDELVDAKKQLESVIKHNEFFSMREKIMEEMETRMIELRLNAPSPLCFSCDTQDFGERIANLGEITQHETAPSSTAPHVPSAPDYQAFQKPIVVVGKQGSAPGEFESPSGIAVEPKSGHIYVADDCNARIQVFSQTGDLLNVFGGTYFEQPYGILFHRDDLYITDYAHHAIFKFRLSDLTMIKWVGKKGSGKEHFNTPKQLAISPNEQIYVPDVKNNRVQILSTNLVFKDSLQHETMTSPYDVKFSSSEMFVLSKKDNPCIHVFTHSGEKSRSLISQGSVIGTGLFAPKEQVVEAHFFCLDALNNILVSDWRGGEIKVFSPTGDLLHTIGKRGFGKGSFELAGGITLHNNKLICLFHHELHVYSA